MLSIVTKLFTESSRNLKSVSTIHILCAKETKTYSLICPVPVFNLVLSTSDLKYYTILTYLGKDIQLFIL